MRLKNLILCLLLCIASASAKDVITKTDGTKLDAKVEEITETLIKYRKASNPTGPIYTIAIESVVNITYENGEVENFSEFANEIIPTQNSSTYLNDDDLIRMSRSFEVSGLPNSVSDTELMRMAYSNSAEGILIKKAKKYRTVGWIGGSILFASGIIAGAIIADWEYGIIESENVPTVIMAGTGLVAGVAWCLGFNLKASSLMRQAEEMQSYSATILENEVLQFGDNSLTAGINIMGNRMVNSYSLGISLGLNF